MDRKIKAHRQSDHEIGIANSMPLAFLFCLLSASDLVPRSDWSLWASPKRTLLLRKSHFPESSSPDLLNPLRLLLFLQKMCLVSVALSFSVLVSVFSAIKFVSTLPAFLMGLLWVQLWNCLWNHFPICEKQPWHNVVVRSGWGNMCLLWCLLSIMPCLWQVKRCAGNERACEKCFFQLYH